jgi:hypothetical protein
MILLTQMFIITESELLAAALRYRISTSPKKRSLSHIPKTVIASPHPQQANCLQQR